MNPNTIDTIATNEDKTEVILGIAMEDPWDDSDEQGKILLQKFESYVVFSESGQLLKTISPTDGYRVKIILYCMKPSKLAHKALMKLQSSLSARRIGFIVRLWGAKAPYPLT